MSNIKIIINALREADKKTYSYQCPYLALADVLGYISPEQIRILPSSFDRLSMRKMILTSGLVPNDSKYIWRLLEDGYTLEEIAAILERSYGIVHHKTEEKNNFFMSNSKQGLNAIEVK